MKIRSYVISGATALLMSTSAFAACPTVMVHCVKQDTKQIGKVVVTIDTKNRGLDFNKCFYGRDWEVFKSVDKAQRQCVAGGEELPLWIFDPGYINMAKYVFDRINKAYEGLTNTGPLKEAP